MAVLSPRERNGERWKRPTSAVPRPRRLFGRRNFLRPQAAADAPRVYSQGGETVAEDSISEGVVRWLADAGHDVVSLPQRPGVVSLGRVSALRRDPDTGEVRAGASPAWCTAAATADTV